MFTSHLRDKHPSESNIEPKDILCVQVAGLCHDLGKLQLDSSYHPHPH